MNTLAEQIEDEPLSLRGDGIHILVFPPVVNLQ